MNNGKYRALINYGSGNHRLEQRSIPDVGNDEILLKIGGCGICAIDVRIYFGKPYLSGSSVVPGHEFYGQIAAIGEEIQKSTGYKIGDYVTAEQIIPCGKCRFCNSGKYWMCEIHHIHGFVHEKAEGGMQEYLKLSPRSRVHRLPTDSYDAKWTMVEPLACALHAVDRADVQFEDVVVLAGLGPIGMCMLQIIKLKKPRLIIALDTFEYRLGMGDKLGADVLI